MNRAAELMASTRVGWSELLGGWLIWLVRLILVVLLVMEIKMLTMLYKYKREYEQYRRKSNKCPSQVKKPASISDKSVCLLLQLRGCLIGSLISATVMLKKCAGNIVAVWMRQNKRLKLLVAHPVKIWCSHKRKRPNDPSSATREEKP